MRVVKGVSGGLIILLMTGYCKFIFGKSDPEELSYTF